ncbi:MAG: hypothetical protein A2Y70_02990 [Candidatus Aminicenantes bacterium RBG_13_64_14]|nr:MAG: hypothetical protein A2Y70_02990 [Candidatus Aminicenantes bacterium RBG_13_64_14]
MAFMIAAGMFIGLAAVRPAKAQFRERYRPVELYIDLGYMNLNSYPKWFTIGPELELRLGKVISLNPEVSFWFRGFSGGSVHIVPGGTVNLRLRQFFIGGGVIRRISDWADRADGSVVPKFQAGFAAGPIRLSAALLLLNRTDNFVFGLNFGFRI